MWAAAQVHSYDVAFHGAAAFVLAAALGAAVIHPRHPAAARLETVVGPTTIGLRSAS